jgi:dihydroxy-acid dehydratase
MGLAEEVALITDGRFSGGTKRSLVSAISPEASAADDAILKDSDTISIDIPNRKLEVKLSQSEIEKRFKNHRAVAHKIKTGYLSRYCRMVSSADKGAVLS